MKSENVPVTPNAGFRERTACPYEKQTGQSFLAWVLVAAANFIFQAILFGEMARDPARAGEFGVFNSALGMVMMLAVPLLAMHWAFRLYPALPTTTSEAAQRLRASSVSAMESLAWVWGAICCVLILVPLPLPYLPRISLQLLVLMNVLIALGAVLSQSVCEGNGQFRRWTALCVAAAFTRVVLAGVLGEFRPWADAGLAVILLAGFITLAPALRPSDIDWKTRLDECRAMLNRDFLLFAGATCSVFLGIFLFTNADRIASLRWADYAPASTGVISMEVYRNDYDSYQAAGLLARGLLWGTQPLLWILYAGRVGLKKTTVASMRPFWIYLGVLVLGAIILGLVTQPWTGNLLATFLEKFGPTFAAIAVPLGLLQGLGIFALASGRYPECFTLGGCAVAYALALAIFGTRPDIMLPLMLGLSVIAMMIVLFVGVVRWGRKQP
jgi:hypothetical protein